MQLMDRKKVAKIILVGCAGIVAACGAGYVFLRPAGIMDPGACVSERMKTMPNLSGAKVEIVYANCDTLAKDEAISVYFSRAAEKEHTWYERWFNQRTLVFRYDPGRPSGPPSMESLSKDRIVISIPEVSSVAFQTRTWKNVSVGYDIRHIQYP
jgi:hypothetical protein